MNISEDYYAIHILNLFSAALKKITLKSIERNKAIDVTFASISHTGVPCIDTHVLHLQSRLSSAMTVIFKCFSHFHFNTPQTFFIKYLTYEKCVPYRRTNTSCH